jgi:glycosyltransferase involved in cell wall biosynthesis
LNTGLGRFLSGSTLRRVDGWKRRLVERSQRRGLALLARPGSPAIAVAGARVAVIGLFGARIGLSQAALLLAEELRSEGAQVALFDCCAETGQKALPLDSRIAALAAFEPADFDLAVLHINPPEFSTLVLHLAAQARLPKVVVGFFAWELSIAPASWRGAIAAADAVWVPSRFVRDALAQSFPELAERVSIREHQVTFGAFEPPDPERRREARARLGLPADAHVVLQSFSMRSTMARKNPLAAIAAFRLGFPPEEARARLVLRCLDHEVFEAGAAQIRQAATGDTRIDLRFEAPTEAGLSDYYAAADVYLSLHRSEGFGLNLAECLHLGLPVVATAWGLTASIAGHPLFHAVGSTLVPVVDPQHGYDRVPGARWAEANAGEAAAILRRLAAPESRCPLEPAPDGLTR